ncbi:MAG: Uma2 family endonuclease [Bacteroidota bacterium]|nr:Uma2 family endonuclease [Bacteroidota bacterium]
MKIPLEDITLSVKGPISDSMSDGEFFDFCQENDALRIERDENKQIIIMAPTNMETGRQNSDLATELAIWNRKVKKGVCFDSSTGFTLPDGSVRSPDASWMTNEKANNVSKKEKQKFAHVCPDFVIELKSPSDNLKYLTDKMHKWIKNGCALAWLINPQDRTVMIFRKNGSIDKIDGFHNTLSGEDVLPGFELNLSLLL